MVPPTKARRVPPDRAVVGSTIGRYVVVRTLGQGGMGTVFLAYDPELDRRVAVKLLRASKARDTSRSRLMREAQAMARVSHPNVVAVHDVGTHGDRVFITMEYIEGGTLQHWLRTRRPWGEVVEMFAAAGRGLLAAHEAGLIHRDFKPENVLVTARGEVKVTDFGLVRSLDESISQEQSGDAERRAPGAGEPPDEPSASQSSPLTTPLTRAGAVIGTPAYMSPEQFASEPVDPRADQWAFCAALHQGLYGQLPFSGDSMDAIRERVLAGKRDEPPRDRSIPAHVQAVLERGLRVERDARWSSMAELLDALLDDPRQRRRRWLAGGAVVASFGGAVLGAQLWAQAQARELERSCTAEAAQIEASWDAARREELRVALVVGEAEQTRGRLEAIWRRAEGELDRWSEGHRQARRSACMVAAGSSSAGERSQAEAQAQIACLDRQLSTFAGTLEAFEAGGTLALVHAVEATTELPMPESCLERAGLESEGSLTGDGAASPEELRALTRRLAQAQTLNLATRYGEARSLVVGALEGDTFDALYLAAPALRARTQHIAAVAAHGQANYDEAHKYYLEAFHTATEAAEDRSALLAVFGLIWLESDRAHFDRAAEWAALGESLTQRLGGRAADYAQLYRRRGRMHQSRGAYAEAEADYRRALEAIEEAHGPEYLTNVTVLTMLAYVLREQGKLDGIPELYERALQLVALNLGEGHPRTAMIAFEQGKYEQSLGHPDEARAYLEQSIAGLEQTFGPTHPLLFGAVNSLAMVDYDVGRLGVSRVGFARAIAMAALTYGEASPRLGQLIANAAVVSQDLGLHAEALEEYERGRALIEAGYGPDYDGLGYVDSAQGELYIELGELELAKDKLDEAKRIFEVSLGPEHVMMSEPMRVWGTSLCAEGRIEEGLTELRQSLAIAEASDGPDHPENVDIQVALAHCEIRAGAKAEGLALLARGLRVGEGHYDAGSIRMAKLLRLVAEAELSAGELEAAREHAERALAIVDALDRRDAPAIAYVDARLTLAWAVELGGGSVARAEQLREQARARLDELAKLEGEASVDPRILASRRAQLEGVAR
ncbi:serine/threonine kinase family protein [Plesiocystis pacifica SIR-1]|uniref:Serine/threonine kinase family protein n=1 Tax=Plesiocystis pacifica SIR-1 TaxID=391625 RepID=A6FXX5_9BACT|nr:serine/threonine-protein kinase [Plesiocystis pacifica]EDM81713.1 serine/threonine kinase family protein [Plesiocystis pacifica SIR-1]